MEALNMTNRPHQRNIRFSDEELARLDKLGRKYGLDPSDVIRFLLKKEEDSLARMQPFDEEIQREMRAPAPTKAKKK